MYKTVQIIKEAIMAFGKSRSGFLHSSAVVAKASKPIYAKKTDETPCKTPVKWFGINGLQLSGFT